MCMGHASVHSPHPRQTRAQADASASPRADLPFDQQSLVALVCLSTRAIVFSPTHLHTYNYLGLVYHQQPRYRQTLTAYRQALQHDANLQAVQAQIDACSKQ